MTLLEEQEDRGRPNGIHTSVSPVNKHLSLDLTDPKEREVRAG